MGIFQSCLAKNNKVGVMSKEEAETYEKVVRSMVTEDVTEKKGGVAFGLSFTAEDKTPKLVPNRLLSNEKEDFDKWKENQVRAQTEKQERAQQRRDETLVQRKIENAHKELERLEKYVNVSDDIK